MLPQEQAISLKGGLVVMMSSYAKETATCSAESSFDELLEIQEGYVVLPTPHEEYEWLMLPQNIDTQPANVTLELDGKDETSSVVPPIDPEGEDEEQAPSTLPQPHDDIETPSAHNQSPSAVSIESRAESCGTGSVSSCESSDRGKGYENPNDEVQKIPAAMREHRSPDDTSKARVSFIELQPRIPSCRICGSPTEWNTSSTLRICDRYYHKDCFLGAHSSCAATRVPMGGRSTPESDKKTRARVRACSRKVFSRIKRFLGETSRKISCLPTTRAR
ncbi:uncharacterized protein LOC100904912 [Galendromus occidentalis]|uniref:Uncharacterized protein LOC100904912 n=1 Tax=Galendromus occidentalis TaxID=34638 RepID=A0AAJ6QVS9_9ACAR|nr:uncharacterized protein LOC100904912 [Galendromus occidentalis]